MSRSCARPGCGRPAVATLSYAYADGTVWLEDLAEGAHPMGPGLCSLPAGPLRGPPGWELCDQRSPDGQVALDLVGA